MPPRPEDSDLEHLASHASQGDSVSLEALLVRYLPRLVAFLRSRIDAQQRLHESVDDLAQSTCRELLAAGPDFQWQGESRFRSWLFTAAWNKVLMRLRAAGAQKRKHAVADGVDLAAVPDAHAAGNSPSQEAQAHELEADVERALEALPESQREVVALARIAGLPIEEVARVMGRTENAVRTLLSRGLVALAAELDRLQGHSRDA